MEDLFPQLWLFFYGPSTFAHSLEICQISQNDNEQEFCGCAGD